MQWTSAPNIAGAPLPQRARGYWKAHGRAAFEAVERFLEAERAQLPPWLAVGLGLGIAAWFALGDQNGWRAFLCLSLGASLIGLMNADRRLGRSLALFALAASIGCALAWGRAEWVASPRLERPVVTEFQGTVERVDHLAARGVLRLMIHTETAGLPPRVRVSIPDTPEPAGLAGGAIVKLRARLAPPPTMALPGTYDFARDAWFAGIGAVGKALGDVTVLKPAKATGLDRVRDDLHGHIAGRLPAHPAGIAIAFVTGDQNAVQEDDADAMRRSGLTHLLSVSGLHIAAVIAAAMFLSLRLMAFSEWLALRFNLVLVSAGVAAAAGIGYTLLTGAQVPTVRSCVAALLVLGGIALGRDALSMRLIATGAVLVLLFRPEALAGPSFQMSFASVTAIVALHSSIWARRLFQRRDEGVLMRIGRALVGVVVTGLAVELALMPFALFHFHRAGLYGVGANIIAIPLTTFVIMPLEAGALLLDVVGWGKPLWLLCGLSIDGLLGLARWVSSSSGAVALLPSMPGWAFGLMVAGGLWLSLWVGRVRLFGLFPIVIGAAAAATAAGPDLLVTGDGMHLAIVDSGRTPYILRDRAGDYVRSVLAEAAGFDGDPPPIEARGYSDCSTDSCVALIHKEDRTWRVLATRSHVTFDWLALVNECAAADIVVSDRRLPRGCAPKWLKLDRQALGSTGAVAVYLGAQPRVDTVSARVGAHPWAETDSQASAVTSRSRPQARFRRDR